MSNPLTDDPEDWLDAELLADDPPSPRMWRREANGGLDMPTAMRAVPLNGQITVKVGIAYWRRMKRHVDASDETLGTWVRGAVAARLLKEGVPASEIEGFLK